MDFVWPYYSGEAKGRELELSIRSVKKYYQGDVRTIVLSNKRVDVGADLCVPIPRMNSSKYRSFRDVLKRLQYAFSTSAVGNEFIWMMDDIYFVNPVTYSDLKQARYDHQYTKEDIHKYLVKNKWRTLCRKSFDILLDKGQLVVYNYACHLPLMVEKTNLRLLFHEHDFNLEMCLWEVLYYNLFAENPIPNFGFSTRFAKPPNVGRLEYFSNMTKIFNNTNSSWCSDLDTFLENRLS